MVLQSKPAPVAAGLSQRLPGADLPLYLERGPTPATPSFKVSRIAVPVQVASAASNAADAGNSIDDDETTRWASAAGASAITYRMAQPTTLTEVTMKLSGWRERSYPVRIAVDGEEVFNGMAPRSLGYVTLPVKPKQGSLVTVELVGAAEEGNAVKMTEVANQAIVDTGANSTPKGVLSIVEIEFYRAALPE